MVDAIRVAQGQNLNVAVQGECESALRATQLNLALGLLRTMARAYLSEQKRAKTIHSARCGRAYKASEAGGYFSYREIVCNWRYHYRLRFWMDSLLHTPAKAPGCRAKRPRCTKADALTSLAIGIGLKLKTGFNRRRN